MGGCLRGCGWTLALVTGIAGFFFPPIWLLTIAGVLLALFAGRTR